MKKMHVSQILVIIFALLVCISTVLPAVNLLGITANLLESESGVGSGVILIGLAALTIVTTIFKKRIPALILAGLNLSLAIYQYSSLGEFKEFVAYGFYLLLASSVLLFAATIFMFIKLPKAVNNKLG